MGHVTRIILLSLSLLVLPGASYALDESDIQKYTAESSQMRREHTLKLKELHVKHINDLYDLRLKHIAEIDEMIKQLKPDDKEGNKKIIEDIKAKRKEHKSIEKDFRENFKDDVFRPMRKEFRQSHKQRQKRLKVKGRLKNSQDAENE